MASLKHTMAEMSAGNTRRVYGTAYWDGNFWFADVGGNLLTCRWADSVRPRQGSNLIVDITTDDRGLSTALVVDGYSDQPRPSIGTIWSVGDTDLVVITEDGTRYTTDRFVGSYIADEPVRLAWDADQPTVLGRLPSFKGTTRANPPKSPGSGDPTGTLRTPATRSGTFGAGGWGRWAEATREDVFTGTAGGVTLAGAWFYGVGNTVLAGRGVGVTRFRLPQRIDGGEASETVHLYAHTSSDQPDGNVDLTVGPFDVTVHSNAQPQWLTLPGSFLAAIIGGGGIAIAGSPHLGFSGRLQDPDSGKLETDWTT